MVIIPTKTSTITNMKMCPLQHHASPSQNGTRPPYPIGILCSIHRPHLLPCPQHRLYHPHPHPHHRLYTTNPHPHHPHRSPPPPPVSTGPTTPHRKRKTPRGRWTTEYQSNYGYFVPDIPGSCPVCLHSTAAPLSSSGYNHARYTASPTLQDRPHTITADPGDEEIHSSSSSASSTSSSSSSHSDTSAGSIDTASGTSSAPASAAGVDPVLNRDNLGRIPSPAGPRKDSRAAPRSSRSTPKTPGGTGRQRNTRDQRSVTRKSTQRMSASPCRCREPRKENKNLLRDKEKGRSRRRDGRDGISGTGHTRTRGRDMGNDVAEENRNRSNKRKESDQSKPSKGKKKRKMNKPPSENDKQSQEGYRNGSHPGHRGTNTEPRHPDHRNHRDGTRTEAVGWGPVAPVPLQDDAEGRGRWGWPSSYPCPSGGVPLSCSGALHNTRRFVPSLRPGYNPRCYKHKGAWATQCIPRAGKETPTGDTCSDCFWFDDDEDEGYHEELCCGCYPGRDTKGCCGPC
eukprot:gb/GECH01003863.1/.p1 GENE.gb/GECH01003863.1/~~gb/GECH01003863.1/.p1  ORF type:complete len:512 (+),score=37.38 gb/GECH01003863.1/:1-1536(+)